MRFCVCLLQVCIFETPFQVGDKVENTYSKNSVVIRYCICICSHMRLRLSSGRMYKVITGCFWYKKGWGRQPLLSAAVSSGFGCALPQGLHSILYSLFIFFSIILCCSECSPPASAIGELSSGVGLCRGGGEALVLENKGKKVHCLGRWLSQWGLSSGPAWMG